MFGDANKRRGTGEPGASEPKRSRGERGARVGVVLRVELADLDEKGENRLIAERPTRSKNLLDRDSVEDVTGTSGKDNATLPQKLVKPKSRSTVSQTAEMLRKRSA